MDERTIINDVLELTRARLTCYQNAISETANMELRQTLKQLRDNIESFQYEVFKVASSLGYYIPADPATPKQIQNVKKQLENL